ncbi:N-acetylmuramoyl-L-alanine amidase [Sphingomonas sp. NFR15]|uniref:N-acetylmuramoyl-L-alanine amidase n=1 Tax=Sphingomonas sp. NFR15 TaxID=1566282 RepID=UPI00088ED1CC|nr:N-acetylmuramoyl-L-alanine amidase [Sphingomonas sp. NFR15]SDA21869.1 N-acetylmuramoyl-L-alanine amidase [Sphingomonas sp. NFR15]
MPFRWTGRVQTRHYARVLVILALLACWLAGAPGWAATVQRVDVHRDRIVLHFDRGVADASAYLLARPRRIAVDVAGAVPGRPVNGNGVVTAVRQSRHGASGLRILLDLARPAVIREGSLGDDGRDLTIALRTVDDAAFARAANEGRVRFLSPMPFGAARPAARKYQVAVPIPTSSRKLRLPRIYGDDESRPLVVIDAGHGGQDPGAIAPSDGRREKDVTLRIAKAIRDELVESGRVRVALTREDDRFIVLQERFGIARKLHASLFISIHCDSVGSGDASGASVYTLSEVASDKESARLAARENKADIIAGVNLASTSADISSILIDLTQRETMNSSASFARLLGREAQPLVPMKPNFHRMASLMVLKAPDMPSILFETGYISNPRDADFIDSDAGRHAIAESVRRAVDVHFARRLASTR